MKRTIAGVLAVAMAGCASAPQRVDHSVVIHVGETKPVGPDGLQVTLRSASADSGCLSPTDCSTMMFSGSIAVRKGDKNDLIQAQSIMQPGQALTLDLDGYKFQMTDIRRDSRNQLQATFVVPGAE